MNDSKKQTKWIIALVVFILAFVEYNQVFDYSVGIISILFGIALATIALIIVGVIETAKNKNGDIPNSDSENREEKKGMSVLLDKVNASVLKNKKAILITSSCILVITLILGGIFDFIKKNPMINPPMDGRSVEGKQYLEVIQSFEDMGFHKIETEIVDISSKKDLEKSGQVVEVSIKGETEFKRESKYRANTPVIIKHYTDEKACFDIESSELSKMSLTELQTIFDNLGFSNVEYEEIKDVKNKDDKGKVIELSINGKKTFDKDDIFNKSDTIKVTYYSAKYDTEINISCRDNLLLNRYDVTVFVDDEEVESIEHGSSTKMVLALDAGEHVIRFEREDDSTIDGETTFVVDDNTKCKFKVLCRTEQISVTTIKYLKTPVASETVQEYKYKDIKTLFEKAGFTNIEGEKITDLDANNLANKNVVESVAIGKKNQFGKDDRFFENTKIVIKYHTPIEVELPSYTSQDYSYYVEQLKTLGFINIETKEYEASSLYKNGEVYSVETKKGAVLSGDKISIDTKLIVKYCVVEEESEEENGDISGGTSSSKALTSSGAAYYFAKRVEKDYPYKIKVHSSTGCINCEQQTDGSYFVKCYADVTNAYGKKQECVVEGYIKGTADNPVLVSYYVY